MIPLIQICYAMAPKMITVYHPDFDEIHSALNAKIQKIILSQAKNTNDIGVASKLITDYDFIIDGQPNVSLNACIRHANQKAKVLTLDCFYDNTFAKVDDLNFNRIMNKEVTLLGYNKNLEFDVDSAVQIGAHLNRYICHGLLSPCPGKEYTLDMS